MKNLAIYCILLFFFGFQATAQNLNGAYIAKDKGLNHLLLVNDGYLTLSTYADNAYKSSQGGTYQIQGDQLLVHWEFNDQETKDIGNIQKIKFKKNQKSLSINNLDFKQQPSIKQELDGLWRITARKNAEQELQQLPNSDRKTIKLLIDGYFQWIAINPIEKTFHGTGGGSYIFKNGIYTEHIKFFSRDNSRIGATLSFNGEVNHLQWHHTGKSSKGAPIYEIWTKQKNKAE